MQVSEEEYTRLKKIEHKASELMEHHKKFGKIHIEDYVNESVKLNEELKASLDGSNQSSLICLIGNGNRRMSATIKPDVYDKLMEVMIKCENSKTRSQVLNELLESVLK